MTKDVSKSLSISTAYYCSSLASMLPPTTAGKSELVLQQTLHHFILEIMKEIRAPSPLCASAGEIMKTAELCPGLLQGTRAAVHSWKRDTALAAVL